MNLILCGFSCSGKTTVGKAVAERLNRPFIDTDDLLGNARALYQEVGEEKFRQLESEALLSLSEKKECVIATGGGIILLEKNREFLRNLGKVVYLRAPALELAVRLDNPAFLKSSDLMSCTNERFPLYESIADEIIDTDGLSLEAVEEKVSTLFTLRKN